MKFYLEEILGLKKPEVPSFFIIGGAVHKALETLHMDIGLFRYPNDILPIILESEAKMIEQKYLGEGKKINWSKPTKKLTGKELDYKTLKEDWAKALINYCSAEYNDPSQYELLANEYTFVMDIGGKKTKGTLDQVRRYHDTATVTGPSGNKLAGKTILIDAKTDKNYPNQKFLDRDVQLSLYSIGCLEAKELYRERLIKNEDGKIEIKEEKQQPIETFPDEIWYYLAIKHIPYKKKGYANGKAYSKGDERGDPRYVTTRKRKQLEFTKAQIIQFAKEIDSGDKNIFQPNPSTLICANCSVAQHCMAQMVEHGENDISDEQLQATFSEAGLDLEEELKNQ